jgi:hypothetical protein
MKNVALITGASSGIGKELAYLHAEQGGDLIIVARSEKGLNQLKAELEKKHQTEVLVLPMDLSLPGAGQQIFDQVQARNIHVDVLINNAGFGALGKFHEHDWASSHQMIQLNVVALAELTRHFLPGMVQRKKGKVLNVSSTAAVVPGPLQAVYYATKAFVTSFSNAIWEELRGTGVTVTNLMPGATDTQFAATADMDKTSLFKNPTHPRTVAQAGYQAMMAGKLDVYAGLSTVRKLQIMALPFTPKKMALKMVRSMQESTN